MSKEQLTTTTTKTAETDAAGEAKGVTRTETNDSTETTETSTQAGPAQVEVISRVAEEDDETQADTVSYGEPPGADEASNWLFEAEVAALGARLEEVEITTIGQGETIADVRAMELGHHNDVRRLELRLRDERILEIARGMEDYLHRVQDTHASLRATLDEQSNGRHEAWRLVAIITLVAWILVGSALAVPDVRVTIGRSMLTERERLMIELVEEAWERDETARAAGEGGHDDG